MIRKYKNRPVHKIEEAIRFEYSNKGLQELMDFCGLAFVSSNKNRHIGAIGKAVLYLDGLKSIVFEGDYVTKDEEGKLHIMPREYFVNVYEEIE